MGFIENLKNVRLFNTTSMGIKDRINQNKNILIYDNTNLKPIKYMDETEFEESNVYIDISKHVRKYGNEPIDVNIQVSNEFHNYLAKEKITVTLETDNGYTEYRFIEDSFRKSRMNIPVI